MKLVRIPPAHARQTWPLVQERIKAVADRSNGRFTEETILRAIEAGEDQFWVGWDEGKREVRAVMTTTLSQYATSFKTADILIVTGEGRKEWKHLIGDVEAWAKSQGCGVVQVYARKGWARELPDYKLSHVLLEKRLD